MTTVGDTRALAGRRVVLTRAPEQSDDLERWLLARGAEVLRLPLVRFLPPSDTADVDRAIAQLEEFDWLIFNSANAVRFFLLRCRERGRWPRVANPQIAVIGPATRDVLEREGLRAARMPRVFGGATVAVDLAQEVAGKRVLLPRSDRAGNELPLALRNAGAEVTAVAAYCTAEPETLDEAVLDALRLGEVDAITFFSPSAFHHFVRVLGPRQLSELAAGRLTFAAVGPTTAAAIRAAGVPVAVEAATATSEGLVAALEHHFGQVAAGAEKVK